MKFEEFKEQVIILEKKTGNNVRSKYIDRFINKFHPQYGEQIERKYGFVDGYCYLGYLWDYVKEPSIIDQEYLASKKYYLDEVFVFWDIHSSERIWIKDYWKFDKDAVLKLKYSTLLMGEIYLPEDIYIFDYSFSWTLIQTHEELNGKRYCLKCGKI